MRPAGPAGFPVQPVPARAGIGLRAEHYRELDARRPAVAFLEVHSENYFGRGGIPHHYLERLRRDYPLSLHGVGLSLGSCDPLDAAHLRRIAELIERYQPSLVSEHLAWSSIGARHANDLLPMPYIEEAVDQFARRIAEVQDALGRELLVENVSCYLEYRDSSMAEWEFVTEVVQRSGCGLLLDVNNIYVNAVNHGFDPYRYLAGIPGARVREVHLAGHAVNRFDDGELVIDTHNARVCPPVWELYREALRRFGPRPTLIEWDTDLPALDVLLEEAALADRELENLARAAAA
jgi:uncharacterized protein (UPF0276 family)